MANTFTSRDTLKTKLLAAVGSATTADQIVKLSRSIEKANLDDDADLETALDTKVSAMAASASTADIEKLAFGVKKLRTPPSAATPTSSMVAEGSSNLYVTDSRVRSSFSASGDLSYNAGTGVLSYTALPDALTVYATVADLPASGVAAGAKGIVEENKKLYIFTGASWVGVGLVDQKPNFTTTPDGSYALTGGADTVITLAATDPQGDPITYSYQVTAGALGGTTVSQADNVFTISASSNEADAGSFSLSFTASDGTNLTTTTPSEFTLEFSPDFSGHYLETGYNNSYYYWGDAEGIADFDEYDAMSTAYKQGGGKGIRSMIIDGRNNPGIVINLGTTATLLGFVTYGPWTGSGGGSTPFGGYDRTSVFNVDTNQWEVITNYNRGYDNKYGAASLFTGSHQVTNNPAWAYGEAGVRINRFKIEAYGARNGHRAPQAIFPIFG